MSGPDIFVVIRTRGDGYGHNSESYVAWYFDEREADAAVKASGSEPGVWLSVEKVPAGTPMLKQDRW